MSVLIIGGDQITPIKRVLGELGATEIKHWSARKKSSACTKKIPQNIDCVLMLTNFLHHNAMIKYKREAKKKNIPLVCANRNINSVQTNFETIMGV